MSHYAYKTLTYIFSVPLDCGAILTHDCILSSTTKCEFLNLCYDECKVVLLVL